MNEENNKKTGWLARLREGLARSTNKLAEGISNAFTKRKLDSAALEELEELLISADMGHAAASRMVAEFAKTRFGKDVGEDEVREALAESIAAILFPYARALEIDESRKPFVVMFVGVNGSGKTTTIGKMAKQYAEQGKKIMLAAGDTFRAAAVSQLKVWGERAGCEVVATTPNGDAAALAFQALQKAKEANADMLFIDTAGRLQNKSDLMQELAKISRVLKKLDAEAPHAVLLVLDATTGQNAHSQVEIFKEMTNVTGLVVTKLDGSARGGVLVALAEKFGLPVNAVGVGEGADDLRPFSAAEFARSLMGAGEQGPK